MANYSNGIQGFDEAVEEARTYILDSRDILVWNHGNPGFRAGEQVYTYSSAFFRTVDI